MRDHERLPKNGILVRVTNVNMGSQQGRGTVVLLDVSEYEKLLATLELLQDVHTAEQQIDSGKAVPHGAARKRALGRIAK